MQASECYFGCPLWTVTMPLELVRHYGLPHREAYAGACHLCYEARLTLRERFPAMLAPDQMVGVALCGTST